MGTMPCSYSCATQAPQLIHADTMGAQSMAPTPTTSASPVIDASP